MKGNWKYCPYCGERFHEYKDTELRNCTRCGTPLSEQLITEAYCSSQKFIGQCPVTDATCSAIEECLTRDQKVDAIKEVRLHTQYGLSEAKYFVEHHSPGDWEAYDLSEACENRFRSSALSVSTEKRSRSGCLATLVLLVFVPVCLLFSAVRALFKRSR